MLFFLLLFAPPLLADIPTKPADLGEDTELSGGKALPEFFRGRAKDKECREKLDKLKAAYWESDTDHPPNLREPLLAQMQACGECRLRDRAYRVIRRAGGTTHEYVFDGSCLIDLDEKELESEYERIVELLRRPKQQVQKFGGFPMQLEYFLVDHETGKEEPWNNRIRKSPFHMFAAFKGLVAFGRQIAFGFYVRGEFDEKETEDERRFDFFLKSVTPAREFWFPHEVEFLKANGKKEKFEVWWSRGHSQWHVRANRTAARPYLYLRHRFGIDTQSKILLEDIPMRMAMENLLRVSQGERADE